MSRPVSRTPARHSGLLFVSQFLQRPTQIGAIAPSGDQLASCMLERINFQQVTAVAEFGPGAGSFTRRIVERLAPATKFFAVEFNPEMARELSARMPHVKVHHRSAADICQICAEEGLSEAGALDVIVSGLPWASFPESLQRSILGAAVKALKPGGMLVSFGYHMGLMLPAGRRFSRVLPGYFSKVERSGVVWKNVPPAFVWRCTK